MSLQCNPKFLNKIWFQKFEEAILKERILRSRLKSTGVKLNCLYVL